MTTPEIVHQTERTALYRLYNADDQLLYVGITSSIRARLNQHAVDKSWWPQVARHDVEWFDARTLAAEAEVAAIRSEAPQHNGSDALDRFRLHRKIYETLRAEILAGSPPPGSQIPSEADLCKRFSTSRTTVRKAIAQLRSESLVVSSQGARPYVSDPLHVTAPIPITDASAAADALVACMSRSALVALTQNLVSRLAAGSGPP